MTFLEYVAERLMGPPAYRSGGRSTWRCPFHHDSSPSFCTLPPKDGCKDRYRCFGCGVWGDEADLMKRFFDTEDYSVRRQRLEAWREDFRREQAEEPADVVIMSNKSNSYRGDGGVMPAGNSTTHSSRDVGLAWANIQDDLMELEGSGNYTRLILTRIVERCEAENVSVRALLNYWLDLHKWMVEGDMAHFEECNDPNCEAAVCLSNGTICY